MEVTIDLIDRHSLLNELNDKFQSIAEINEVVIEQPTVEAIPTPEVRKILRDCANEVTDSVLEIVRKEYIPKADYENRLKADMAAILVDLQLEIEEIEIDVPFGFEPVSKTSAFYEGVSASSKVIQQKINSLKE